MSVPLAPCGTKAARARHRRRDETCEACAAAVPVQRPRAAYRRDATNAERSRWDEVLEKDPPLITWVLDRRRRVLVHVEIHDPHGDGAHNSEKAACMRGHEFTEANTIITRDGRQCRTCKNDKRKPLTPEQKQRAGELRKQSRKRLRQERSAA